MSDCDVKQLMRDASPFVGMGMDQMRAAQVELLCRILTSGIGITGFTPGSVVFASETGTATEDNDNFFYDDSLDQLILGDRSIASAFGQKLSIYTNANDAAGTVIGIYSNTTIASGSPTVLYGMFISTTSTGTGAPQNFRALLAATTVSGGNISAGEAASFNATVTAGTHTIISGAATVVGCSGSSSITTAQGNQCLVQITSPATAGEARGCLFQIAGSGTITTAYGVRSSMTHSGTVTTSYAAHFQTATGGTITTRHGLFLNCRHAADIGIFVQQAATPTGDVLRVVSSAAATLIKIDSGGQIWLNNAAVAETPTATHTVKIKDSGGTEYRLLAVV